MKALALEQWTPDEVRYIGDSYFECLDNLFTLVYCASCVQDELLRKAVRRHGVRRWDCVSFGVPNRSEASCSARWDELQTSLTRQPWSLQEDEFLRTFVSCQGASQWAIVASLLPGRNAKQCRDRWHHQLDPSIKREAWSSDEDLLLATLQRTLGNAWSRMVAYLPGRTDNAIKNRWHSARFKARMGNRSCASGSLLAENQGNSTASPQDLCVHSSQPSSLLESNLDVDLERMWAEVAACLLDDPYDGDGHDGD